MIRERTAAELWLLELERERNSIAYRKKPEIQEEQKPIIKQVTKTIVKEIPEDPKKRQLRDSIMYHAGRYSAGIRDAEAINGFKKMTELLTGEQEQQ
jgi:hypothetical protein